MRKLLAVSTMALMVCSGAIAQDGEGDDKRMHRGDKGRMHDMVKKLDTDKDGSITRAEVDAFKKARFDEADSNGDGSISKDELKAASAKRHAKMEAKRKEMEAKREEMRANRHEEMEADKSERQGNHFTKADKNGDGAITINEFGGREVDMFERFDADGDGVITQDERKAEAQKKRKQKMKMKKRQHMKRMKAHAEEKTESQDQ